MAAGIFTIKPKFQSDVVCTLGESTTVKYYVLSSTVDWKEQERVKINYVSGGTGGSASGEQRGLANATFSMVVFGTDQADAMAQLRILSRALTNKHGGFIQYRPRGLGASVLSTYYHYLQSPLPAIRSQGDISDYKGLIGQIDRTHTYGIECKCTVAIKAWATSDPTTPVTIKAATSIENFTDDSNVNYVVVENSAIKGDGFIPIIEYSRTDAIDCFVYALWAQFHKMTVGNTDVLDFVDSDEFDPAMTNVVDATVCGGEYERTTDPVDATLITPTHWTGIDQMYFGKVSPIACVKTSGSYTLGIEYYQSSTGEYVSAGTKATTNANWALYPFNQIDFPIASPPDYIANGEADDWLGFSYVRLGITRVSAGNFDIDFVWIPRSDEWLAKLYSLDNDSASHSMDTDDEITIDAFSGMVYRGQPVTAKSFLSTWNKDGPSLHMLVFEKGFDHRISFLALDEDETYRHGFTADVTVYGLHATIYPFEEA